MFRFIPLFFSTALRSCSHSCHASLISAGASPSSIIVDTSTVLVPPGEVTSPPPPDTASDHCTTRSWRLLTSMPFCPRGYGVTGQTHTEREGKKAGPRQGALDTAVIMCGRC